MKRATEYFVGLGWSVKNVSSHKSFDLLCERKGRELRVEVKGTTGYGHEILLTRNEVEHALSRPSKVALFILSEITLKTRNRKPIAVGGVEKIFHPWKLSRSRLQPRVYSLAITSSSSRKLRRSSRSE